MSSLLWRINHAFPCTQIHHPAPAFVRVLPKSPIYHAKLSYLDKEVDTLMAKQKKLMTDESAGLKKYEDLLVNITD